MRAIGALLAASAVALLWGWPPRGPSDATVESSRDASCAAPAPDVPDLPVLRYASRVAREESDDETPGEEGVAGEEGEEPPAQEHGAESPDPGRPALPLDVEFMDAETGTPVVASFERGRVKPDERHCGRVKGKELVLRAGDIVFAAPIRVTGVPSGFVDWDPVVSSVYVASTARALRLVHPLRREVDLRVEVLEPDGRVRGDASVACTAAGRALGDSGATPDASGRLRIRGVAHLAGEPLRVTVSVADPIAGAERDEDGFLPCASRGTSWAGVLPDRSDEPILARIVLPVEATPAKFRGPGGSVTGCPREETPEGIAPPTGVLEIEVVRRDGSPAAGAWVIVEACEGENPHCRGTGVTLDARGRSVLTLVGGRYVARLLEPGLVPTRAEATVRPDATTTLTVVEPVGAGIALTVVDERGAPLPFATAVLGQPSRVTWLDVDDAGLQRLDAFVDERGRRGFEHVESGDVEITVAWATRSAKIAVSARDGATVAACAVLARPAPASPDPDR